MLCYESTKQTLKFLFEGLISLKSAFILQTFKIAKMSDVLLFIFLICLCIPIENNPFEQKYLMPLILKKCINVTK